MSLLNKCNSAAAIISEGILSIYIPKSLNATLSAENSTQLSIMQLSPHAADSHNLKKANQPSALTLLGALTAEKITRLTQAKYIFQKKVTD